MYMDNWNGKYLILWDFFNLMNSGFGKNLNWFFNNWFFINNYIDFLVKNVVKKIILVENIGGFVILFDVNIVYVDDIKEILY